MSSEATYDLAGQAIGCAMAVHRTLGSGFLESVYHRALSLEMDAAGLAYTSEQPLTVSYRDQEVGTFKADFVVADQLIVELKATQSLTAVHEVQLVNYLTATKIDEGLLLNFGQESLKFTKKFRQYQPPALQS